MRKNKLFGFLIFVFVVGLSSIVSASGDVYSEITWSQVYAQTGRYWNPTPPTTPIPACIGIADVTITNLGWRTPGYETCLPGYNDSATQISVDTTTACINVLTRGDIMCGGPQYMGHPQARWFVYAPLTVGSQHHYPFTNVNLGFYTHPPRCENGYGNCQTCGCMDEYTCSVLISNQWTCINANYVTHIQPARLMPNMVWSNDGDTCFTKPDGNGQCRNLTFLDPNNMCSDTMLLPSGWMTGEYLDETGATCGGSPLPTITTTTTTSSTTTTTNPGTCPITNASITAPCMNIPGTEHCCRKGDVINIGVGITPGPGCVGANLIQFDAHGATGCNIEFQGGDMAGMTGAFTYGGASHYGDQWFISDIPSQCAGQTMTPTGSGIYNGNPGTGVFMSQWPTKVPTGSFKFCGSTTPTTTLPGGSTTTTLPLSGRLDVYVYDGSIQGEDVPVSGAIVDATIISPPGQPSTHVTDSAGKFTMYVYDCNSDIRLSIKASGFADTTVTRSVSQGSHTLEVRILKPSSNNVDLNCVPASDIGDVSNGVYEVCTFNNIANLDNMSYDTVGFLYKIYSYYVPDHVTELSGLNPAYSNDAYLSEISAPRNYSGKITAKFARRDGLYCTAKLDLTYRALHPLNPKYYDYVKSVSVIDTWIYDSSSPYTVVACLGTVVQSTPGVLLTVMDKNYNNGAVSVSSDTDSFSRAECYTDAECSVAGFGSGSCINNKCSVYPKFESGYPKSIITQDQSGKSIQAVSLKWSTPQVCKPGTGTGSVACDAYSTFDFNFDVYRVSIDGGLQSTKTLITSIPSMSEFVDEFDGVNQSQLVGKNAYYKVCARLWNSNTGTIFCTDEVSVNLVGCVDSRSSPSDRRCFGDTACSSITYMCANNFNCSTMDCDTQSDCTNIGCSQETYVCAMPSGGSHKKCMLRTSQCNDYITPVNHCSDPSKYCSDQSYTMTWLKQNTGGSGTYTGTDYYTSVESNSWCVPKITDPTVPCYNNSQCVAGTTCKGYYVMSNGSAMTCTFNHLFGGSLSVNRCFDGLGSLVGYCYPDNKCRVSGGGRCASGSDLSCDPLHSEPNPACSSSQYCSSSAHICVDKGANGMYCNNDFECTSDICNPTTHQCAGNNGTCVYSICKDRTLKGADCGCPSPKICVPLNWGNSATWSSGKCIDPLPLEADCGSKNSLGIPISQLQGYWHADWICGSLNCLGDNFVQGNGELGGKCKPATTFCDANTLTAANILDPEHYCHCSDLAIGPDPPCANIDVTILATAVSQVVDNPDWCYIQTLSSSKPNGVANPDYRCYKKLADTSTCDYDYQCVGGKCGTDKKCTSSGGGTLGATCRVSNLYSQTTAVWNSNVKNPETGTVKFWSDNCGTDPTAGALYCEPCDYTTGFGYDEPNKHCTALTVTHGTTGRCRPVHYEGEWCYSSNQCSPDRVQIGGQYQNLYCGVDSSHQSSCYQSSTNSLNNWYCFTGNSDTFNKYCIRQTVSGCIHDSKTPYNQFTTYDDDTCYTMSKLGQSGPNTFCDDKYMCVSGSTSVKCQDLSSTQRATASVVPGNCVTQKCTIAADGKPYFSTECWRSVGYSDLTHNVAPATTQLVYCGADGFCRWRKQAGDTCSYDKECDEKYVCLTTHTCGTQTGCIIDADCKNPETHKCVNGQCVFKGVEEFGVIAVNNLTKPAGSPNTDSFDFVVNCKEHDTFFRAYGTHTMSVKYCIGSCASGTEKFLGDSETVMSASVTGDLYNDLCNEELKANRQIKRLVSVTFSPVIAGQQSTIQLTKNIIVLARPVSLQMTRCSIDSIDPLCSGYADPTLVYPIKSNNSYMSGNLPVIEQRRIKCDSAPQAGVEFVNPIYPRTELTTFGTYTFAVVKNWKTEKYYKCVDEYGTVKIGSTLVNPAEYIFGLQFTRAQQVFLMLVAVLGIPTLVLIGSRVGRRQ